jgi:hypothetical protein
MLTATDEHMFSAEFLKKAEVWRVAEGGIQR